MSNSNRVTVDNLGSAIMKYLKEYKEDISEDVKELADKNTKEARNELKAISPVAEKTVILKGGGKVEPRKLCKILVYKKWSKSKRSIFKNCIQQRALQINSFARVWTCKEKW